MKTLHYNDTQYFEDYVKADIFAIDIETNTTAPPGSGWTKSSFGLSNSAPISYVSIYVENSLPFVLKMEPVESDYNYRELNPEETMEALAKQGFIQALFNRESDKPYRAIGHNVVFDIGRLGSRYEFQMNRQIKVWDTLTMAARLMLGETNKDLKLFELGLDAQLDMYDLRQPVFFEDTDAQFYSTMKSTYRKDFERLGLDFVKHIVNLFFEDTRKSHLLPYISNESRERDMLEDALFSTVSKVEHQCSFRRDQYTEKADYQAHVLRSYQESEEKDELIAQACELIIAHYVAMDTVYTYRLYKLQIEVAKQAKQAEVRIPIKHKFVSERVIPYWPDVLEHVNWEQQYTRELCRQAIQGVIIDRNYVQKTKQDWLDAFPSVAEALIKTPDPSDPYPTFRQDAMMVYWFSRILEMFAGHHVDKGQDKSTVTYSKADTWVNWEFTRWGWESIANVLDFSSLEKSNEDFTYWVNMWVSALASMRPDMSKSQILKGGAYAEFQITQVKPKLNFEKWVYETCFKRVHLGWKLAQWKAEWLAYEFSLTEKKMYSPEKLPKNKKFQKYFTFIKAGIPIPDHRTAKYGKKLVTPSHKEYVKRLNRLLKLIRDISDKKVEDRVFTKEEESLLRLPIWRNKKTEHGYISWVEALAETKDIRDIEADYQAIALENEWLSVSKKGILFYLPPVEDENDEPNLEHFNHPLRQLYDAIDLLSLIASADKYLQHSERDNKIHSIMSRMTRTGRTGSSNPNMQNDARDKVIGWIVPPDESFVIIGVDLSNAENVSGAMISGDSNFALSTEQGDYHWNRALVYFKDEMQHYIDTGQIDKAMKLRSKGKPVTFGKAYGEGDEALSVDTGMSRDEIKELNHALETTYPVLHQAMRERSKAAEAFPTFPSFVSLWSGSRVIVPMSYVWRKGKRVLAIQGYRTWNYLQQGAVGEIIARSMVLIQNWLEDNGYESYILFNVHDELVLCLKIAEVDQVVPKVCEIMGEVIPIEYRKRTIPMAHFVADLGPENAFKWGFQENVEYPLSLDHFWNRYGKFELPEEELSKAARKRKTPTWRGPVHQGWTLESEMEQQRSEQQSEYFRLFEEENNTEKEDTNRVEAWRKFKELYSDLYRNKGEDLGMSGKLIQNRTVEIAYGKDTRSFPDMQFEEWMELAYVSFHRGHSLLYRKAVEGIAQTFQLCLNNDMLIQEVEQWINRYGHLLLEVMPGGMYELS